MHRLAGGRILVFPTASSEPEGRRARRALQVFRAHGFDAEVAPLTVAQRPPARPRPRRSVARVARLSAASTSPAATRRRSSARSRPAASETPVLARDPRRAGGGRARRRLERRRGDDVAADDPRRHLDRVGGARRHRRPRAPGPADGHRPRLLSLRHASTSISSSAAGSAGSSSRWRAPGCAAASASTRTPRSWSRAARRGSAASTA